MAYFCCKKIAYLVDETDAKYNSDNNVTVPGGSGANSGSGPESGGGGPHAVLMAAFYELMNDPYTRFLIFGLSAVVQHITMECPVALVWHYHGENKTPTSLLASPLDYLPNVTPSGLPMPPRHSNPVVRMQIKEYEEMIKQRSAAGMVTNTIFMLIHKELWFWRRGRV